MNERSPPAIAGTDGRERNDRCCDLYNPAMPELAEPSRRFLLRLVLSWAGLSLLFAALAPASSAPLSGLMRLVFWSLHIGFGLACATGAAILFVRNTALPRDWRLISLSALGGVVLFAPAAVMLESLFPAISAQPPDDPFDVWAAKSLFRTVVAEALAVAPSFIPAWMLINLDALVGSPSTKSTTDESQQERSITLPFALPSAVGDNIVAISSDLHYLHVYTTKGKAMVLGSLSQAMDALGDEGIQIHRSHWIATAHVKRLKKTTKTWQVEMSNQMLFDISRRKRSWVVEQLGTDFEVFANPQV
ncbi:MAG: LytTR family DNA-binding domain-containing protein [Pseudomonadota bacterium]